MAELIQWEYQTKTFGGLLSSIKDEEFESRLDQWGEDGWEVVSAFPVPGTYKFRVIAKRPLTPQTRRERSMPGFTDQI